MRKSFVFVLAAIFSLQDASVFAAQQAEEQFQQARTKEIVSGDREGAIRIYAEIAGNRGTSRQLVALSLFELARLYEELGRKEQALKALNQLVDGYAEQGEMVAKARQRLAALVPVRIELRFTTDTFSFALSPDGSKLVFSVATADQGELWLRDLRTGKTAPIPGAVLERNSVSQALPFWSPDGRNIAFFSGGKLMRIGVEGGRTQVLADATNRAGGSWAGDFILYSASPESDRSSLFSTVRADGDALPSAIGIGGYQPSLLPDGKHFLFFRVAQGGGGLPYGEASASLWIGSIDGQLVKNLSVRANAGTFVAPDTLLYVVQQGVFAQRMDMNSFELLGEPRRIADKVALDPGTGKSAIAVSKSGQIAFSTSERAIARQLVWVDRDGKQIGAGHPADPAAPYGVRLSPDGRRILVNRQGGNVPYSSTFVLEDGQPDKTVARGGAWGIWSPDGDIVVGQGGPLNLVLLSGNNLRPLATLRPGAAAEVPEDWSRDGRYLLYRVTDPGDVWVMSMTGDAPRPLVELPGRSGKARLAPDGRWFAYQSNDQSRDGARRMEVFVQPFSGTVKDRIQVTTAGGTQPAWSGDGTRLYYLSFDYDLTEIEVRVAADGGIRLGKPKVLFRVAPGSEFDVHPDGTRFLINRFAVTEPFVVTVLPKVGW